jgi:predicted DNA-binding protein (MmcQ/YjbR family)
MDAAGLRDLCLGLAGAEETFPFDDRVSAFKVGGRVFALCVLAEQPLHVIVKCEPHLAESHRATWPDAVLPGYHMNKRHWNSLMLGGALPDATAAEMIEDSYDLVCDKLGRAVRLRLGIDR